MQLLTAFCPCILTSRIQLKFNIFPMTHARVSAILVAGGRGLRMNMPIPKQFLTLQGIPVALHSFHTLCACEEIFEVVVVCDSSYSTLFTTHSHKKIKFATPGDRRQDSVQHGLDEVSLEATLICIHDSARPFLSPFDLKNVIAEANVHGAAVLANPVKHTIKEANDQRCVKRTLDRSILWEIYTPQIMTPQLLKEGFAAADASNFSVTDDASLVELLDHPVKLVQGVSSQLKITTPEDWTLAQSLALSS